MAEQAKELKNEMDQIAELCGQAAHPDDSADTNLQTVESRIPVNWEQLVKICDDPEILEEVAHAVLEETPQAFEQLKEAISNQDAENIQLLAHRIKGTAKNMAAGTLAQKAFDLEQAAKNDQLENTQAMLAEIQTALDELTGFLSCTDWIQQASTAV